MKNLEIFLGQHPHDTKIIDLDTGKNLCEDNPITRVNIDIDVKKDNNKITIELRPETVKISGPTQVKCKRVKLK